MLVWFPINQYTQESDDGRFRVVHSDKGYTAWMKPCDNFLLHRRKFRGWIRLEIFPEEQKAKQECEENNAI